VVVSHEMLQWQDVPTGRHNPSFKKIWIFSHKRKICSFHKNNQDLAQKIRKYSAKSKEWKTQFSQNCCRFCFQKFNILVSKTKRSKNLTCFPRKCQKPNPKTFNRQNHEGSCQ
jgi:hypothetical protein